jgi:AcrR family transcriptional regulator
MAGNKPGKKGAPKIDQSWHDRFLEVLKNEGAVLYAARKAGVSKSTVYEHRERFPEFAEQWDLALDEAVEDLEVECRRRARDYSDLLLIFLLKAHRPQKYRETRRFEVTGPNGSAIEIATPQQKAQRLGELIEKAVDGDDDPEPDD